MAAETSNLLIFRKYVFDYSIGALWTADVLLLVPSAITNVGKACSAINVAFAGSKAPDMVIVLYSSLVGILIPYVIGLLGTTVSLAIVGPLLLVRRKLFLSDDESKLTDRSAALLRKHLQFDVQREDVTETLSLYLLQVKCASIERLLSMREDVRFRMAVAVPLALFSLTLSSKFGASSTVVAWITSLLILVAFAIFLSIEDDAGQRLWRAIHHAALLQHGNLCGGNAPELEETQRAQIINVPSEATLPISTASGDSV